jgi:hypothetical protein
MSLSSKLSLLILISSATCFAQFPVSIGVKAGVPITDSFNNVSLANNITGYSNSKNYIVGPMVELKLPFHLSVEADALYRPLTITTSTFQNTSAFIVSSNHANWEFPILAKYHFSFPIVKPYLEVGPSFRTTSVVDYLSNNGVTVGAGVDVHALVLRISPEFRYTHWSSDSTPALGQTYVQSKQDQVEFLVGFSF